MGTGKHLKYNTPVEYESRGEGAFVRRLQPGNPWGLMPLMRQFRPKDEDSNALDVLAMDCHGAPWVFEFKRDVAHWDAVGQLLAYGSWIGLYPTEELIRRVRKQQPCCDLHSRFRTYFNADLPKHARHPVFLVIVAHSFSPWCKRAISFLAENTGLHIGLLKMQLHAPARYGTAPPEFEWEQKPTPAHPAAARPGSAEPLLLCLPADLDRQRWRSCIRSGGVAIDARARQQLGRFRQGQELFVAMQGSGLIGYGDILESARTSATKKRAAPPKGLQILVNWRWHRTNPSGSKDSFVQNFGVPGLSVLSEAQAVQWRSGLQLAAPSGGKAPPAKAKHPDQAGGESLEFRRQRKRRGYEMFEAQSRPAHVAKSLGVSITAATNWFRLWQADGGNQSGPPATPGRPPRLQSNQWKQLQDALIARQRRGAKAGSRKVTRWTAMELGRYIQKRFRVAFAPSQCNRLMHKLGLYKQPKKAK
ncbi:MAG: winged helix-turn-helix domain-containing protein [Limisphaerales bacterium]